MEFEVGDIVNSSYYSDNQVEDHKIIKILTDKWSSKQYVIESLSRGTRMEKSSYQISHSKSSMKWMNSVCDCGAKKVKDSAHIYWCESQKSVEKELRNL